MMARTAVELSPRSIEREAAGRRRPLARVSRRAKSPSPDSGVRRLGIADLGSNTARLIVFSYEPGRWYRITDGIREPIRLGEGLSRGQTLAPAALKRAAAAIELFVDYARASGLDGLEILGTSAIRDAVNRDELLERIDRLGQRIRVVSGEEEAALGVAAVANGFRYEDAWVIDLGGGSAQVSRMRERRYDHGTAHPLGALRLSERFLRGDPPKRSEIRALESSVEEELGELIARLDGSLPVVAIGGTVRNLARMSQKAVGYPLQVLHGYRLSREALEDVTAQLLAVKLKKRRRIPGINSDRADIITAGALVFRWLMRRSGLRHLVISGHGVREGAFYRHFLPAPYVLPDVCGFSIENRAARHPLPPGHAEHVRFLADRLFDGLAPLHQLTARDRELLDAAATLHDIGTTLDYYRHHKHGSYLLTISPLNGFCHRELALIALLVRYHRRGNPRLGEYGSLTEPGDRRRLRQLSACLRIAESLERARASRIKDLRVTIKRKRVRITVQAAERPMIEIWEASKHANLFRRAFDRKLDIEADVSVQRL